MPLSARLFFACALAALVLPTIARGQEPVETPPDAVALLTSGPSSMEVSDAFVGLVPLPSERRIDGFDAARLHESENDTTLGYVVSIATDRDLVQVLRRADGARFERRFEAGVEDAYAVALVAAELLEVAKSGGDPRDLGLVATVIPESEDAAPDSATSGPDAAPSEPAPSEPETSEPEAAPAAPAPTPAWALTIGGHAELWVSPSEESPWLLQPGLVVDALFRVGDLLVGGGVFASGLGAFEGATADATATYHRYDFGARLSAGLDAGPAATRLLLSVRGGGSLVTADGRTSNAATQRSESATVGTGFLGLAFEARQPLTSGLNVYLTVGADLLPAPVRLTAFGQTLVREGSARVYAQLGAAWVFE